MSANAENPSRPHQPRRLAALGLAAVFLAYHAPQIFFGQVYAARDVLDQFIPFQTFVRESLFGRSELPLWDPYLYCGFPLVAELQAGIFYPLNWLQLPFDPVRGLTLISLLHFALGLAAMYRFCRALRYSRVAAACSAICYVYGSQLALRFGEGHLMINWTAAWLPVCLIFLRRLLFGKGLINFAALTLALALLLLAGSPQFALYCLFVIGAAGAFWAVRIFEAEINSGTKSAASLTPATSLTTVAQTPPSVQPFENGNTSDASEHQAATADADRDRETDTERESENKKRQIGMKGMRIASAIGAPLLALLIAAIQLLPTWEWRALTHERGGAARREFVTQGSLEPQLLWTWLLPDFFQHPQSERYWGRPGYHEQTLYCGVAALPLALLFLLAPFLSAGRFAQGRDGTKGTVTTDRTDGTHWKRNVFSVCITRRQAGLLLAALLLVFLIALGKHTPLHLLCAKIFPPLNWFRYPARFVFIAHFLLALCAGGGLDVLLRGYGGAAPPGKFLTVAAPLLFALPLLAGLGVYFFAPQLLARLNLEYLQLPLAPGAAAFESASSPLYPLTQGARAAALRAVSFSSAALLVLLAAQIFRARPPRLLLLLPVLLGADLLPWVRSGQPAAAPGELRAAQYPRDATVQFLQRNQQGRRMLPLDSVFDWRLGERHAALLPNRGDVQGIFNARGRDPFYPKYLSQLINGLAGRPIDAYTGEYLPISRLAQPRLLGLLNVKYILDVPPPHAPGETPRLTIIPVNEEPQHAVLREAYDGANLPDAESVALLGSDRFDASRFVLLPMIIYRDRQSLYRSSDFKEQVELIDWSPSTRRYKVSAKGERWFVLSESYHPGWRAYFDGRPVDVSRANHAFIAALIPGSDGELVWKFQPRSLRIGFLLSLTGLSTLALCADFTVRIQRRRSIR